MSVTSICLLLLVTAAVAKGVECSAGCNPENGFCEKPGECRCKPGWQGAACDQCMPFPGCLHGTCEKAWQCICEEGWAGSQCDQDTNMCSSKPCSGNSTCIETGEGGFLCICPHGYTGENCHLKKGPCLINGSPCQNRGTCVDAEGLAAYPSCLCLPGFAGDFCEIDTDSCEPNPCLHGGNCTDRDNQSDLGQTFTCTCPSGLTGPTCNATLSPCASGPCVNGATCVADDDGAPRCACRSGFTGPTCAVQHKPSQAKATRPGSKQHPDKGLVHPQLSSPQHYSLSAHAFHKLLQPRDRDLLKITLKETVHSPGGLVTRSQLICFGMLGLLTCLVILGTTSIIFYGRCEAWMANAKYSQLVRQQREHLLKGNSSGEENSVNIILPEKIRLTSFGKHYTSI